MTAAVVSLVNHSLAIQPNELYCDHMVCIARPRDALDLCQCVCLSLPGSDDVMSFQAASRTPVRTASVCADYCAVNI